MTTDPDIDVQYKIIVYNDNQYLYTAIVEELDGLTLSVKALRSAGYVVTVYREVITSTLFHA